MKLQFHLISPSSLLNESVSCTIQIIGTFHKFVSFLSHCYDKVIKSHIEMKMILGWNLWSIVKWPGHVYASSQFLCLTVYTPCLFWIMNYNGLVSFCARHRCFVSGFSSFMKTRLGAATRRLSTEREEIIILFLTHTFRWKMHTAGARSSLSKG